MYRYKCIVKYDGYNYMGFQIQNELPTIELTLVEAIKKMLNIATKIKFVMITILKKKNKKQDS